MLHPETERISKIQNLISNYYLKPSTKTKSKALHVKLQAYPMIKNWQINYL